MALWSSCRSSKTVLGAPCMSVPTWERSVSGISLPGRLESRSANRYSPAASSGLSDEAMENWERASALRPAISSTLPSPHLFPLKEGSFSIPSRKYRSASPARFGPC